jgi:YD repeat-containing protein
MVPLSSNALDQLTRWDVSSNGQEWYAYDALGQRVAQRTIKGGVTSLETYAFGVEEMLLGRTPAILAISAWVVVW